MATGRLGAAPVLKTRWTKEPTAGTTSLSGLDANSVSLVYSVGYEQVYRNGVLLSRGNDYTATDGTTITLTDATLTGDIIEVFANELIPLSDAISKGQYNGKGALVSASAASTPATLAVGSNGDTLVADSSTTTGLRWSADWNTGKNKIINGDFNINQRNFTSVNTGQFTFDRWSVSNTGGSPTFSAQTFTLGAAPVAGYEATNFIRLLTSGQSAANDATILFQKIEDVRTFANQTITVSFWAKANTGTPSVAIEAVQDFGTGGSPSSRVNGSVASGTVSKIAITTSWARYSATLTVPSISGKTLGTNNNSWLGVNLWVSAGSDFNTRTNTLGIQSNTFDIWGVQAEAGSVATPFTTATGTLAGELAACERYFQAVTGQMCSGSNTTTVYAGVNFRTQMRTAPTVGLSGAITITDAGADYTQSSANVAIQSSRANERGAQITMANFASITVHRPYSTTITSAQIQFSAEL